MSKHLHKHVVIPILQTIINVYMKIAEPRNKRLIYFVIYILLGVMGGASAFKPSPRIEELLGGLALIYFFGGLIIAGALLCLISVLPGIWMFERAGLVGLGTGIVMYSTTLILLGSSPAIVMFPTIIILVFVLRWLDIKDYLLAPRKG